MAALQGLRQRPPIAKARFFEIWVKPNTPSNFRISRRG